MISVFILLKPPGKYFPQIAGVYLQSINLIRHDPAECVGFILTFSDGVQLYIAGDTDKTAQMETFAERNIDYAFFPCDGRFNMDVAAASECAALVGARHSIPYHTSPGALFDREVAERFQVDGRLIVADGEEITLESV